jgi:hypothetical protein
MHDGEAAAGRLPMGGVAAFEGTVVPEGGAAALTAELGRAVPVATLLGMAVLGSPTTEVAVPVDGGMPPAGGGMFPVDGGMFPVDGGIFPFDGGMPTVDGGIDGWGTMPPVMLGGTMAAATEVGSAPGMIVPPGTC